MSLYNSSARVLDLSQVSADEGSHIRFCIVVLFQTKTKTAFCICNQENEGEYLHTLGHPHPLKATLVVSLKDGKASGAI